MNAWMPGEVCVCSDNGVKKESNGVVRQEI